VREKFPSGGGVPRRGGVVFMNDATTLLNKDVGFQNFFQLFNLPLNYAIDCDLLANRYRELQRQVHPDRFVRADQKAQERAIELSSQANEAYKILKNPLLRAVHLIECLGEPIQLDGKKLSSDFLMKQMEWHEKIEGWFSLSESQREQLRHLLQQEREHYLAQLTAAFERQPVDKNPIEQWINEWQFIEKLRADLPD